MEDNDDDSDSEVEIFRKRKLNVLEDEQSDNSDNEEDDDETESESDEDSEDSDDYPDDDIQVNDDVAEDQCAVCLMGFTDQKVGVPDNCNHVFCLFCIQEWSKNINTCPVDRKVFYTIAVKKAKDGPTIEEIKVEDRTQPEDEFEDPTTCEICGVGDRADRMLLCDGCDRGFHLECLTPPLESVPDEEWFCIECFVDNTQDSMLGRDCVDYSQHAIVFSDDEMPTFGEIPSLDELPISSVGASSNSRLSSTSQRRARTVATSPRRRRRRHRTTQRPQVERQRTKRKKSKKAKPSDKGASTSSSSASISKKRKSKKRRKSSRKKRKIDVNIDENVRSNTKYLLPHEMDPTATFSLFGSDYDLEYLPVIEKPSRNREPPRASPRPVTTGNRDVLGSIFTGLNYLNDASVTVDNKGRLRIEESRTTKHAISKEKDDRDLKIQTSDSSPAAIYGSCAEENGTRRKLSSSKTPKFVKRSVHFGSFTRIKDILPDYEEDNLENLDLKEDKLTSGKHEFYKSTCSLPESKVTRPAGFGGYKIPRKTTTSSTSTVALVKSNNTESACSKSVTNSKSPLKTALELKSDGGKKLVKPTSKDKVTRWEAKISDVCRETSGILHLLPSEGSRVKHHVRNYSSKQRNFNMKKKDDSVITIEGSGVPGPVFSNVNTPLKGLKVDFRYKKQDVLSQDPKTTSTSRSFVNNPQVNKAHSRECPIKSLSGRAGCFQVLSVRHKDVSNNVTARNVNNANSLNSSERTGLSSGGKERPENSFSSGRHNGKSSHESSHKTSPESAKLAQSLVGSNVVDGTSFPKLTSASSSSEKAVYGELLRPVAVVRPTKVDSTNGNENTQADKKRKEGIERLRRKQMICEEIKTALKPFYRHGEITKENYKYIYGRAFEKISESSLPVVSRDVSSLVKNYVKKLKGRGMLSGKNDV